MTTRQGENFASFYSETLAKSYNTTELRKILILFNIRIKINSLLIRLGRKTETSYENEIGAFLDYIAVLYCVDDLLIIGFHLGFLENVISRNVCFIFVTLILR